MRDAAWVVDTSDPTDLVERLRAEASHATLAGSHWKRWDLVHVAVEAAAEIDRLRAASPSEEANKLLKQASDWMHLNRKTMPIRAIDAYLAALRTTRQTKEGETT